MTDIQTKTTVALIGAGPIGLEMAAALKRAGIDYLHFEKGQIGQTISWFPPGMRFFSGPDRIAICGVPIARVDQSKATKEEYLAYLRAIVEQFDLEIRTYEPVIGIAASPEESASSPRRLHGFRLRTSFRGEERSYRADKVILATGDMHIPRRLEIPGEDLPHVSHYLEDPHKYFRTRVLVVGGKNSAVEAANRLYLAGARSVTIVHRGREFEPLSIKYWLLPEILNRIARGEITAHFQTSPIAIRPGWTTLAHVPDFAAVEDERPPDDVARQAAAEGHTSEVEADFVLLMVGYRADTTLFRLAGVSLEGPEETPAHNPVTMETNVPGLYVAGTTTAGSQQSYRLFIENCHIHVERILAHLLGTDPPEERAGPDMPES